MRVDLPAPLTPTNVVPICLPSGRILALPHCYPSFAKRALLERPLFTFGNKTVLDFEGQPVFAELMILRLLQRDGWDGVWISSFGGKWLREMPTSWSLENAIEPPPEQLGRVRQISMKGGLHGGCLDVFAWRGNQVLFCEAKRKHRDHLRTTQKRWIDAALASGVDEMDFLIAEWRLESEVERTSLPTTS